MRRDADQAAAQAPRDAVIKLEHCDDAGTTVARWERCSVTGRWRRVEADITY